VIRVYLCSDGCSRYLGGWAGYIVEVKVDIGIVQKILCLGDYSLSALCCG